MTSPKKLILALLQSAFESPAFHALHHALFSGTALSTDSVIPPPGRPGTTSSLLSPTTGGLHCTENRIPEVKPCFINRGDTLVKVFQATARDTIQNVLPACRFLQFPHS